MQTNSQIWKHNTLNQRSIPFGVLENLFQVDNICLQSISGMHSVENKFHSKQNSLFSSPLLRINPKSSQEYFMIQMFTGQRLI